MLPDNEHDWDQAPATATECLTGLAGTVQQALVAALHHRADITPGLAEFVDDEVVLSVTMEPRRRTLGVFCQDSVQVQARDRCEIRIYLPTLIGHHPPDQRAERILTTGLHESAHAWAHLKQIRDTSREGRYHNRRFAEVALGLGLAVQRHPRVGHVTPGLTARARLELAGQVGAIHQALVFERVAGDPSGGTGPGLAGGAGAPDDRYVSATCACRVGPRPRRLRMAAGHFQAGPVTCGICGSEFRPAVLSESGQLVGSAAGDGAAPGGAGPSPVGGSSPGSQEVRR